MRFTEPLDDVFRSRSFVPVLRALSQMPARLSASAREVARRAGVSHPTATSALRSLADQGIVNVSRAPSADGYVLNSDHVFADLLKGLFAWEASLREDLVSFLREQIRRRTPAVERAFVFGSFVAGGMTASSDIDLAVVCPESSVADVQSGLEHLADDVRKRYGNNLNAIIGTGSVDYLRSPGERRLWKRIVADGRDVLTSTRGVNSA